MSGKIITVALFIVILLLSVCIVLLRKNIENPELIPMINSATSSTSKTTTGKKVTEKVTTTAPEIYRIELNSATYEDFLQLGLTPELAKSCVELRGKISYFSNTLELLYADGMTKAIYREIDDYCYVGEK